jgi:catechol 2,3-dioxygenase-like lactoylglutathione lyase family enzyme
MPQFEIGQRSDNMPVQLNHTIVWCRDKKRSSELLVRILGCSPAMPFYNFMVVHLENSVSLDFMEKGGPIASQHYAFLIEESEFDATLSRIRDEGLNYWADPAKSRPREINYNDCGRGVYFEDLDGHMLEVITQPYKFAGQPLCGPKSRPTLNT